MGQSVLSQRTENIDKDPKYRCNDWWLMRRAKRILHSNSNQTNARSAASDIGRLRGLTKAATIAHGCSDGSARVLDRIYRITECRVRAVIDLDLEGMSTIPVLAPVIGVWLRGPFSTAEQVSWLWFGHPVCGGRVPTPGG